MMYNRSLLALIIALLFAATGHAEVEADLAISTERTHQSFDDGSTDIDAVTLSPSLSVGYWTISATLEWQQVDGVYFVNERYPSLGNYCQRVSTLSSPAQRFLLARGRLTQQQLDNCTLLTLNPDLSVDDSHEGMSDSELFANYYLPPLTDNFGGTIGLGYKHDDGDYDEGLGSGTREAFIETSWLWQLDRVSLLTTVGVQSVVGNNTEYEFNDYGYGSVDFNWRCLEALSVGVTYQYVQAYAEVLEDVDYLDWYVEIGDWHGLRAHLSYRDYRNQPDYPEEEFSGGIRYRF